MFNPYTRLLALLPKSPLQVGEVLSLEDGVATVQLPGGGLAQARGTALVGTLVFFRDGAIEGPAPELPIEVIEL